MVSLGTLGNRVISYHFNEQVRKEQDEPSFTVRADILGHWGLNIYMAI